jgi:site-specific recombinase XerD
MMEDLQLRGLSKKTQVGYLRAIRQLAEHCKKPPDKIDEEDLRQYFLYLTNVKKASRSTCTIVLCGIKFFFQHTLGKEWTTFELVRPPKEKKLPVVLSVGEVQRVLSCVRLQHYRICLSTIYACGLRLREGVHLRVIDIDSERMIIHVRKGKGAKDRYVPLPARILEMLRRYWVMHCHPVLLFPARTRMGVPPTAATAPMDVSGVQRAFRAALKESGIQKHATVHTLRHSYAAHLLEAEVSLCVIQSNLGHGNPQTTTIYTHLTRKAEVPALEAINQALEGLRW